MDSGKGIVFAMSGHVTGNELIALVGDLFSRNFAAEPFLYSLVDCHDVVGMNISSMQLREIAQQHISASQNLPKHVVGVFAKNDLPFALARMWQVFVEQTGWDARVFRLRPEAVDWVKQHVLITFGVAITLE